MKGKTSHQNSIYKGEGKSKIPSFLRRGCRGGLEQRREQRKNLTPAERKLWQKLRSKKLAGLKFRRQHQIGHYIVDFYCPKLALIIEIDGSIHVEPQKIEEDKRRQKELEHRGYRVIRYNNNDVVWNINGVYSDIIKICNNLSPALSLERRGGNNSSPIQGED